MGKRKVNRTAEEEAEFQRLKKQRHAASQQKYRQNQKALKEKNTVEHLSNLPTPKNSIEKIVPKNITGKPSTCIIKSVYGKKSVLSHNITSATLKAQVSENHNEKKESNKTDCQNYNKIKQQLYRATAKGFKNVDFNNVNLHYAGPMSVICKYCNAKHFEAETVQNKPNSFNDCCSHGKVKLEPLPPLPKVLKDLYLGNHSQSKTFYDRIRGYNNAFSFASFNANLADLGNQRKGPYCFKIQGQIYYQINTALYPALNESATNGQLFILDQNEATECRLNNNSNLNKELLKDLNEVISKNNVFAQSYQMMHEEIKAQEKSGKNIKNLQMGFITKKPGIDRGRYNIQKANEVAAIFSTNSDGDIPENYVTIVRKNDKKLKFVSTMDPNVEPWIYPMFYPFGTQGWYDGIKQINGKRVTRSMYIQYRMAVRDEENAFLMGRRLFQQWTVDNYVKVEKDRIKWCKDNQKQLRVETYQGLVDYLENAANTIDGKVGRMVILPSSFIGSPRNMIQNYQDSMAVVRKYGKPDLFITMTCNPNWREITENLLPGQVAADRPDLCARVFDIKKKYLIDIITRQHFFGEYAAYVYVVEFQKRGLPHIHLLVTLKQNNKKYQLQKTWINIYLPKFQIQLQIQICMK